MKILGIANGHDAAYCILEDGVPTIHEEYERFSRIKEGETDIFKFIKERVPDYQDIKYVSDWPAPPSSAGWGEFIGSGQLSSYQEMLEIVQKNDGQYLMVGHHQSHAANAFYSSNFDKAIILTLDAGGWDYLKYEENLVGNGEFQDTSFTIWRGQDNKITPLHIEPQGNMSVGFTWHSMLTKVFDMSTGPPFGNQAGTLMAMAAMGKTDAYVPYIDFCWYKTSYDLMRQAIDQESDNKYEIARALQTTTENQIRGLLAQVLGPTDEYLCLGGGCALNCVAMGKILDWFPQLKGVYVPPVPYDAGLAIGSAQFMYHHVHDNPRVNWDGNCTPYLGATYSTENIEETIGNYKSKIVAQKANDEEVLNLLDKQNIVSVFGGGSESGRRALGNRSILADPRSADMKDLINEKVKHRQSFRPFAPSILRSDVKDWFVHDIDSPYMNFALKFRDEVVDKVPAVVHFDNTGRLQTVEQSDNHWYHGFLSAWKEKTGVPILLNTSFNDREPIVETPEHAIKCFLKTNIDYLYFTDAKILISKK